VFNISGLHKFEISKNLFDAQAFIMTIGSMLLLHYLPFCTTEKSVIDIINNIWLKTIMARAIQTDNNDNSKLFLFK